LGRGKRGENWGKKTVFPLVHLGGGGVEPGKDRRGGALRVGGVRLFIAALPCETGQPRNEAKNGPGTIKKINWITTRKGGQAEKHRGCTHAGGGGHGKMRRTTAPKKKKEGDLQPIDRKTNNKREEREGFPMGGDEREEARVSGRERPSRCNRKGGFNLHRTPLWGGKNKTTVKKGYKDLKQKAEKAIWYPT